MYTNLLTRNSNDAAMGTENVARAKSSMKAKELAYLGAMIALLEIAKIALAVIPNVELVSLLLIIFTYAMGRKAYLITLGYAIIECLLWGMGTWVIMYLYVWPILVTAILLLKRFNIDSLISFSIASGAFGLFFGAFCALTYVVIGGWSMGLSWWISGIPFDLIHGVSNFIICLVLYKPISKIAYKVIR